MFQNAIVLTGGIATGKSTVANLFKLYGFLTIDADDIAHKLLDLYSDSIVEFFGTDYVENGKVSRKKLGNLIFNNQKEKQKLENFIHPLIKKEIQKEAAIFEKYNKPYLIDIPLFFENKNYEIDRSIVVYAPKNIQILRLQKRDNCDETTALARINNQMDVEKKKELGTFLIDNSKDLSSLIQEIERVKNEILKI